jgi:hypothetical protein
LCALVGAVMGECINRRCQNCAMSVERRSESQIFRTAGGRRLRSLITASLEYKKIKDPIEKIANACIKVVS